MSDKMFWIGVDFDREPTGAVMEEIADSLNEQLDHDTVVSRKEIKPMDKAEVIEMLNEIIRQLEDNNE